VSTIGATAANDLPVDASTTGETGRAAPIEAAERIEVLDLLRG
jgi:hypothetical protein